MRDPHPPPFIQPVGTRSPPDSRMVFGSSHGCTRRIPAAPITGRFRSAFSAFAPSRANFRMW